MALLCGGRGTVSVVQGAPAVNDCIPAPGSMQRSASGGTERNGGGLSFGAGCWLLLCCLTEGSVVLFPFSHPLGIIFRRLAHTRDMFRVTCS